MNAREKVRPVYDIPFAGQTYTVEGTFEVIDAVETALNDGIIRIAARSIEFKAGETAKTLAAIFNACGQRATAKEIGDTIINEIGIATHDLTLLNLHIHAFLKLTLCPPSMRDDTKKKMAEALSKAQAAVDSLSLNTDNSA